MSVFTYHLVKTDIITALKVILAPPSPKNTPGLIHAECMTAMTLGSPVFSTSRILVRQVALFAKWENERAIDNFLENTKIGKMLATGWHTRLTLVRQWGKFTEFGVPHENIEPHTLNVQAVVVVTIARMKLLEIPRFIHWGRPVEKLVRDHPGTTLSLASIRLPRTVSTFSIWKSQEEMAGMVYGHSDVLHPKRHINAMYERDRKDFHIEFTTMRFKATSEFGTWNGKSNIIPNFNKL